MAIKDYDKTLTRLISILTMLSLNRLPNTRELAEEFGVTMRTIQKDIYQRLISFPIEKNGQGRFQFMDGFSLDKSMLNSREMIVVSLALAQFNHVNDFDQTSHSIVQKLLYPKFFNPYYIKYSHLEDLDTDSAMIEEIRKSIEEQLVIAIHFSTREIMVEPYKIVNFDGFWYLFAKDTGTSKVKTFMLSKIDRISPTTAKYKISLKHIEKTLSHTHSAWFEEGEGYEVIIKVYPEIAHYFKQRSFLRSQEITKTFEDGSLLVTFEVTHDEDIDNIIKAWLPHIEVLKPERFRKKIIDELEGYLSKLKEKQGSL